MAAIAAAPAAASGDAAVPPPRFICFLCKRKFTSAQLLQRHKQLSELHARNLQKQEDSIQQKKEEMRQCIASFKRAELSIDKDASAERKQALEKSLQQAILEYGQAQERLEANRYQRALDRGATGVQLMKLSQRTEASVGKMRMSVGAATWQGNKDVQEDRYMLDMEFTGPGGSKIIGFLVLDGHSGSLCVEALMESFHGNVQKFVSSKPALTDDHMRQAVAEACVLTDDQFLSKAREREVLDGSTLLLCLMWAVEQPRGPLRHKALFANVGDSRAVLCRAQGKQLTAVRLTDDLKPGRPDERRRIEANGGVVDHQGVWRVFTPGPANFAGQCILWGLAVSRAFGDLLLKEPQRYGCSGAHGELVSALPEVHIYDLSPSDDRFLILACDGIWDVVADEEAVQVCSDHHSAEAAAHALIRHSFQIGSDDNLTAVVIAWQATGDSTDSTERRVAARRA